MTTQELMSMYEEVASITSDMVMAAQKNDWELLASLEEKCSLRVQTIRKNDLPVELKEEERARKVSVIKKILADDRKIRDITEPQLAKLGELINNGMRASYAEQKLVKAYHLDHQHP